MCCCCCCCCCCEAEEGFLAETNSAFFGAGAEGGSRSIISLRSLAAVASRGAQSLTRACRCLTNVVMGSSLSILQRPASSVEEEELFSSPLSTPLLPPPDAAPAAPSSSSPPPPGAIRCFDPCLSCATHALGQMPLEVSLIDAEGKLIDRMVKNQHGTCSAE